MREDGTWGGLHRCDQLSEDEAGVLRKGHGDTRTHGLAIGDIDNDGDVDIVVNNGGFAMSDQIIAPKYLGMLHWSCGL